MQFPYFILAVAIFFIIFFILAYGVPRFFLWFKRLLLDRSPLLRQRHLQRQWLKSQNYLHKPRQNSRQRRAI